MFVKSPESCGLPPYAEVLEPSSELDNSPVHLRVVNPITSPDHMLHAVLQDDPEFHKYQFWTKSTTTIESARVRISRYRNAILGGKGLVYDIFEGNLEVPGDHIGLAGLMKNVTVGPPSADAGYWLTKQARGKRYMSRAMRSIIDYAANDYWPDLTSVNFYIAQGNVASEHVATALGAQFDQDSIIGDPESGKELQANKWTIKL